MKILALDTSMEACSAALYDSARGTVLAQAHSVPGRGHAELLFTQIGAVLEEARATHGEIGRYAVTLGPGSFTGVRVGLAAARGLALAASKPLVGVGTLEAIAAAIDIPLTERLVIAVDARRGELYVQAFSGGAPEGEAFVAAPSAAACRTRASSAGPLAIAGSGAAILQAALGEMGAEARLIGADPWPRASTVARLAAGRDDPGTERPAPVYLRAPDAKLPGA